MRAFFTQHMQAFLKHVALMVGVPVLLSEGEAMERVADLIGEALRLCGDYKFPLAVLYDPAVEEAATITDRAIIEFILSRRGIGYAVGEEGDQVELSLGCDLASGDGGIYPTLTFNKQGVLTDVGWEELDWGSS